MQAAPPRTPPLGVAFDSSLDGEIDQVLALAMLFGFDGRRQIRLAAVSTSRFNVLNVAFLDLVSRFYSGEQGGDTLAERLVRPIGMSTEGTQDFNQAPPMLSAVLAKHVAEGRGYPRARVVLNDTADPVALIRNGLSAQIDQNGAVVLAGPPVNLLGLIARPDGRDWVTTKARVLSIAGGRFAAGPVDPMIRRDLTGFRRLLAGWPAPIIMAGTELSEALPFPGRSLDAGIAWTPHHPIVDAYRAFRPTQNDAPQYGAPSRALAAVLQVVSPDESYFDVSPPGTITIADDGRTIFSPSPNGRHRYLIAKADQKERVLQVYVDLVTAQPPPRAGRGGPRA